MLVVLLAGCSENDTYKLVKASSVEQLESQVNFYIDGGWDLEGGVCVGYEEDGNFYYTQAMSGWTNKEGKK